MAWEVEGTDEFAGWFGALNDDEQVSVGRVVEIGRRQYGRDRWYDEHVPIADTLYDEYLRELEREGLT